ncbi:ribokinase-like domain-containing protein, partial [Candidatus Magnetobacterium bavaricum]
MSYSITQSTPKILGAGLVCLDIIKDNGSIRRYPGGTCGNVVSFLAFLGWQSTVLTTPYSDLAGELISSSFRQTGVEQMHLKKKPSGAPRIFENILRHNADYVTHSFSFTCPECNRKMPELITPG